MQAILYIGHGSRVPEATRQARDFIEQCIKQISVPIQEICFLELAEPNILEGIERCVNKGATNIAVQPVLLLAAKHIKRDIPLELEKAKQRFPNISIHYGGPLGVHENIVDILAERIREKSPDKSKDAMVLLVGRGSSDPDIKKRMAQVAQMLQNKYRFQSVKVCYLTAARPSFKEGLEQAGSSGYSEVFVVPYLLFTGILMKDIQKEIDNLKSYQPNFTLCQYLGYHSKLKDVLLERVKELIPELGGKVHDPLSN
ncbi:sirohydrochlorin chelatase [Scopulibacillus cellulosilyticus]|uniref:Sirohydrochlorin chelatase n=1 Tax=Scopulibacillus cellulosilyticus TaxID=2665665 RepID=A0ABW2Q0X8_9BACL